MGGGELLENLQDDLSQDEDQNEPSNFQAWLVIVFLLVLKYCLEESIMQITLLTHISQSITSQCLSQVRQKCQQLPK